MHCDDESSHCTDQDSATNRCQKRLQHMQCKQPGNKRSDEELSLRLKPQPRFRIQ